jgi:hypothetical protein
LGLIFLRKLGLGFREETDNELPGSRGGPALVFEARPRQWQAGLHPSRRLGDLPDQHRRVHVSAARQHAWYPQGHARASREAVSFIFWFSCLENYWVLCIYLIHMRRI